MSNSVFNTSLLLEGEILQQIAGWSSTQTYLQYLPTIANGWERWAQLDIFFYLSSNKHKARVEEYSYEDSDERMDLTVRFDGQARTDFVELKALSFLVAKELKTFFADVKRDAKKLIDGTYQPKFNGGYAWAIGLLPKTVVLDQPDSNGNKYTAPQLNLVLTPSQADALKKTHIERVLKPLTDAEM